MTTLILSFLLMGLAIAGMAIGVMARGRPITGSCGGLNKLPGLEGDCGTEACPCKAPVQQVQGEGVKVPDLPPVPDGRQPDMS